jgi:hypothetical protein
MKTIIDETLIINLKPEIIKDETRGLIGAKFKWGILAKPEIISKDENGVKVFCPNNIDPKIGIRDVQSMRLFSIHIVKQMIENKEQIDQTEVYSKINFELPDDIKNFIVKVLEELEIKVLDEIFYHNNPIKPIKEEIKKISI